MKRFLRKLFGAGGVPSPVAAVVPPVPLSPLDIHDAWIARGNAALDAGHLAAAAAAYDAALDAIPASVSARVNLAFVQLDQGAPDRAEPLLLQAVERDATNADAHYLLGTIAKKRGDAAIAAGHFERAMAAKPDFELAYRDACEALFDAGRNERAIEVAVLGLAAHPTSADLLLCRANLQFHAADATGALKTLTRALTLHPSNEPLQLQLALAQRGTGELAAAASTYRRLLTSRPDDAALRVDLASCLSQLGMASAAIEQFQRAIVVAPGLTNAHLQLGVVLQSDGQTEAAIRSYRMALALDPLSAVAHCNLGLSLSQNRDVSGAWSCFEQALRLDPGYAPAHAAIAVEYNESGHAAQAADALRKALRLDPGHAEIHSNLLFMMSFLAEPDEYFAEARRFGELVSSTTTPFQHAMSSAEPEVLRVGFVSGDLRRHPVASFLEGVLAHLPSSRFALHAYMTQANEDEVSACLRPRFAAWRSISGMSDSVAAACIRNDALHVLIDLSGHTAHNRLPVFAWKPAPVQVSWLGYLASTGVPAIDHVLADRASLPPADQGQFTEQVWYLPHSLNCFTPPVTSPPVGDLPALASGQVTFGSFQRLNKVSDATLAAWALIVEQMPGCRLRLQSLQMAAPRARERFLQRLVDVGIPASRVELVGPVPDRARYLACHQQVDIVLDTFPYPGITTTCEALWMGVPTVTLMGTTLLSRQGASLLGCVGLDDWIATTAEDYVRLALRHAADLPALARLRVALRERAVASPLFDPARFAGDLEIALRSMHARVLARSRLASD